MSARVYAVATCVGHHERDWKCGARFACVVARDGHVPLRCRACEHWRAADLAREAARKHDEHRRAEIAKRDRFVSRLDERKVRDAGA